MAVSVPNTQCLLLNLVQVGLQWGILDWVSNHSSGLLSSTPVSLGNKLVNLRVSPAGHDVAQFASLKFQQRPGDSVRE